METKVITIPQNIKINLALLNSKINPEVKIQKLSIQGPLGLQSLILKGPKEIKISKIINNKLTISCLDKKGQLEFGVITSQILKMIQGVTTGFTKQIKLFGVGYKFSWDENPKGNVEPKLFMSIGFSNPVEITNLPASLKISPLQKNDPRVLEVTSTSLTDLNNFAYGLQKIRPVSKSFKGTGIMVI